MHKRRHDTIREQQRVQERQEKRRGAFDRLLLRRLLVLLLLFFTLTKWKKLRCPDSWQERQGFVFPPSISFLVDGHDTERICCTFSK